MAGAIVFAAAVSQAASSYASSYSRDSITGLIGFNASAVNFGANYEHRVDNNLGVGGYFLYGSEKKDVGINQITSFGGIAPMHILDDARTNVYIAPGFGIHMIKGINGAEDVTTFGPLWKIGAMFKMTSAVKVGAEHTQLVNWFSDKAAGNANYTNIAVNFAF
jgi:hypothetical protein